MLHIGFYGRSEELDLLGEELERAMSGRLRVVLVEGEAGIGKTRLAAELGSRVGSETAPCFFGRSDELGTRPFGALAEALGTAGTSPDPARREIDRLLAAGTAAHDPGLRQRLVDAFVDLIEAASHERGAVLVLDDLQWSDASTLLTVRSLARGLTAIPLLVLALFRPSPRNPALERLADVLTREGARQITLGPLAQPEMAALAREAVGADPGPRLSRLLAGTAGNPLFVSEALSLLRAEGAIDIVDGRAEVSDASLPRSLRLAVVRRIGYLSEDTLEAVRIAAVLGLSFVPADLATVSGRTVLHLLNALEEARRAGVLADAGGALRFRHDVIREALYGEIAPSVRTALHVEVARKLASSGAPALRVAEHYRLGAPAGDPEAVAWLRRAAEETVSSDPGGAVELLGRAVGLATGDQRDDLRAQLATFHAYGGDPGQAESVARELLSSRRGAAVESRARAALVQSLKTQGRWADVVEQVEAGCASAAVDDVTRGRLLSESALARIWVGDLGGAARDAEEAVRLGEASGDAVAVCSGLGHLSGIAQHHADVDEAVVLARRGVEVAEHAGGEALQRHPHMAYGMALVIAGRLREAVAAFTEGRRLGERLGTAWDAAVYHAMLGLALYHLGDWDDAAAAAETSLGLAEESGVRLGNVTALSVLAQVTVHRGDLPAAERCIAMGQAIVEQAGRQWGEDWLAVARANVLAVARDRDAAARVLEEHWGVAEAQGSPAMTWVIAPPLIRLGADEPLRCRVADAVAGAAARAGVAYARAAALLCRGMAHDDADTLLEAVEVYRTVQRPLDVAECCEAAASALARRDRIDDARPLYEEALTIFEALGAELDVSRVAASMRAAGLHRGVRGPRARAASGWDGLTRAELRVARLVADGLTNREIAERLFISRDTVKTHLRHAFMKLDVTSRRELAAEARRRSG